MNRQLSPSAAGVRPPRLLRIAAAGVVLAATLALAPWLAASGRGGLDERVLDGLVQIVGNRGGATVSGSGFIVAIDRTRGVATVVTSSHVIAGAKFTARFAADPHAPEVPVTEVVGIEAENRDGLAVFRVRGAVPSDASALELAPRGEAAPRPAESLTLVGYPNMAARPLASTRGFSGQIGALYVVDLGVGEGSSGGPALLEGRVVGLVTNTTPERTSLVPASTIRTFLEGYSVRLEEAGPRPAAAAPPPAAAADAEAEAEAVRVGTLLWTPDDGDMVLNWTEAGEDCAGLEFAGRSDWRLPTIQELRTIYSPEDENSFGLRLLPPFHEGVGSNWVWSADKNTASEALALDFENGETVSLETDYAAGVVALCVSP